MFCLFFSFRKTPLPCIEPQRCWTCIRTFPSTRLLIFGWVLVLDMYHYQNFPINYALDIWVSVSTGHVSLSELSHQLGSWYLGECQYRTCITVRTFPSTRLLIFGWVSVQDMYHCQNFPINQALDIWVSVSTGHVSLSELTHQPGSWYLGECQYRTCITVRTYPSTRLLIFGWVLVLDMYQNFPIN